MKKLYKCLGIVVQQNQVNSQVVDFYCDSETMEMIYEFGKEKLLQNLKFCHAPIILLEFVSIWEPMCCGVYDPNGNYKLIYPYAKYE